VAKGWSEPEKLGQTLRGLIGRFAHVDLTVMETILARWPDVVGSVLAERCHPEVVRDGVLHVRVPSGAYAQKFAHEEERILSAFADLGEAAPTSIATIVRG
jgi:predicted nucleic acid-binding Zn ribbon protein